ncbi:MAG TPA: polyphosphate polymerase domain-containing protein [Polyangiaceae bacterium]|nr:polyphosphate polymerase domain-containing protein [Polyangiaceae bacterium]
MIRRFNRYELKYILPMSKCHDLIKELGNHVTPDRHGGERGYPLVSLYYDSPAYDCFWAKVDGIKYRRKLRLRIYPARNIEETARGMVEIKQRINRTVQKRRLELPLATAEALCSGVISPAELEKLDDLDAEVASEVLYLINALQLRPAAITAYHRLAFVGSPYESDLRITFDTHLQGRVHDLRVNQNVPNQALTTPDWSIMEVKADERVPDWVTSLLGRHDCQMQRVSKYCAVITHLSGIRASTAALPSAVADQAGLVAPAARRSRPTPIPRATAPSSP